eukprot:g1334.t1
MIGLISVGTPLVYWYLLRKNKDSLLRGDRSAEHLVFLCGDYNRKWYNWEVVETVRKLLLTGVAVFIEQGTLLQFVVAMVETTIFLGLLVVCKPYKNARDYHYAVVLNALLLLYIFVMLLLKFDKHLMQMQNAIAPGTDFAFQKQGYATEFLAWCLIVIVSTVLVLFLIFMWWDMKCLQLESIMRYTEDKALVWFPKPFFPQSFDVLLGFAERDKPIAVNVQSELRRLVDTMTVALSGDKSVVGAAVSRKRWKISYKGGIPRVRSDARLEKHTSDEQLLQRRMEHSTTYVCILTKAFFTRKRCVMELRWAYDSFVEYHRKCSAVSSQSIRGRNSRQARNLHQGTRALLFILDPDTVDIDELVQDATTQDDASRRERDNRHHNHNLINDYRDYPDGGESDRTVGEELHDWLKLNLADILQSAGRTAIRTMDMPVMIPWFEDAHRMIVSLKRVAQEALYVSFDGEHVFNEHLPELYVPGEMGLRQIPLPPPARLIVRQGRGLKGTLERPRPVTVLSHLFLSRHHHATTVLRRKLTKNVGKQLKMLSDKKKVCTHMLVVLDSGGGSADSSPSLSNEGYREDIIQAANLGLRLIVLHITDASFDSLVDEKLVAAGIRNPEAAIPCPVSVLTPDSATIAWRREHSGGELPPGVAPEDADLELIALKPQLD